MKHEEKGLSIWQLTMLALGTVVGGSFFLGSSVAIRAAGPSVLLAYIIGGCLVYFILTALSEMTVANPASGSFRTYAEQAFGRGAGFTVGWVYWTGLVLAMSSEATAASILLRSWFPALSLPLLGTVIIILVTLLNLLGAERLSKLESGLAAVKLLAIAAFVVIAVCLVAGIGTAVFGGAGGQGGEVAAGYSVLTGEPWMPGGVGGIAGSMLMVMFTYAGFEVLGLAASETGNPAVTIPKAIRLTTILLVGLYLAAITALFLLIPRSLVSEEVSPFVSALTLHGLGWTGTVMNIVLVTAILSTMLASLFGLGRMLRSLADEGHTPVWMRDRSDIPYRGILVSGGAMLGALGLGLMLPQGIYLFLVSSGGFSLLLVYVVIMASHYRLRMRHTGSSAQRRGMKGFPYTSWLTIGSLIAIIASMPLIPGQGGGLAAGSMFVLLFAGLYALGRFRRRSPKQSRQPVRPLASVSTLSPGYAKAEMSEEWTDDKTRK
ncbi:L-asparagine transporter-like permease [Paenibacillus forsythiae]|uniref:L-asparagine transporter-like permease n=1 Tax=Paenibacillus forsythiae TaxID=365616 RepID=A0ABU3H7D8_9BACL|nr:amino acid permease [Paenibacillus forsythiae]MDT3426709.1 L-asparagine transporter-like permease [Paenibacillus forsythiae]